MNTTTKLRQCILLPVLVLAFTTARGDQQIVPSEAALRSALNEGGIITFSRGGALSVREPLVISHDVTLDAGTAAVVISGANVSRVFHVRSGASLTLFNVTVANGRAAQGAGIFNEGTLTLVGTIFTDNTAQGATGASGLGAPGESVAGGAIYNLGSLTMSGASFNGNRAVAGSGGNGAAGTDGFASAGPGGNGGSGALAAGGAIYSSGVLFASNCTFNANSTVGGAGGAGGNGGVELSSSGARGGAGGVGGNGGEASGGAMCLVGESTLISITCVDNDALGGEGGAAGTSGGDAAGTASGNAGQPGTGGNAAGGAIMLDGSTLQVTLASLSGNRVRGGSGGKSAPATPAISLGLNGPGGPGGTAMGGAVHLNGGSAVIEQSSIARNTAEGGEGTAGSDSFNQPGGRFLPTAGGAGGDGGSAHGAIFNAGELLIMSCALDGNSIRGANGGRGGNGGSARTARGSPGGLGGDGGIAAGGAVYNRNAATLINCTIVDNECEGGTGANGGVSGQARFAGELVHGGNGGVGGMAGGAAVYSNDGGRTILEFVTLANNLLISGRGGEGGQGSSMAATPRPDGLGGNDGLAEGANMASLGNGVIEVRNSISFLDGAASHGAGSIVDNGYNLCSGNSCGFTGETSLNGRDPLLGALKDNGGPTVTMTLLDGSPAIDAAGGEGQSTDQRGFLRPAGAGYDIGAVESDASLAPSPGAGFMVRGRVLEGEAGLPGIKVKLGRQMTYTDENGEFVFVVKKKGRYAIRPVERRVRFAPQVQRARVREDVVLADFVVKRRR